MRPQKVQIFSLNDKARNGRYLVRWRVDGRDRMRRFKIKAEAERYRSQLMVKVVEGERFDPETGLPASWQQSPETWWSWSRQWVLLKWPGWAGHSRRSSVETLVLFTPHLVASRAGDPPAGLRSWLLDHGYRPGEYDECDESRWLDRNSLPMAVIGPAQLELALAKATTRQDGRANAPTVVVRRRNTIKSVFTAAVRRELIPKNPMDRIEWRPPLRTSEVDISVLPSVADVDRLVAEVASIRTGTNRYAAFFAAMGLAGLRPSEVADMRVADLHLPGEGWGLVNLRGSIPAPGKRYSTDAQIRERKGLKRRADDAVRPVPLPPELVRILRDHLDRWPAQGGLVFTNRNGRSVTTDNYNKTWNRTKAKLWPPGHALNGTEPYDLRHTAATVMIRAGVPLPEVARRLGHSVEVLLRVYAGVFENERERSNEAIEREFERQRRDAAPEDP